MVNIELRHLRYFIAVAEELNFGQAAKRLHIAQPPLTRQIHQLEQELGVKLLRRTTRRIELTEAGQVYLAEARRVLAQVAEGITLAQLASRGEAGRFAIGFEGSSAYDIVPLSVRAFKEQFPQVNMTVYEMSTGEQVQALQNAHIGAGFVVPPLSNAHALVMETILREPLVVALPQNHPLSDQVRINVADLTDDTFIICPRHYTCGLYDHVIAVCHHAGFSPKLTQETNEVQSILGFVAAELGIALLPASVMNLQRSGVVYRRLQDPAAVLELALAWRQQSTPPMLPAFLEIVRRIAHQVPHQDSESNEESCSH